MHKKVAFHTLGCKLNFSETSTLSRIMENEGFEKTDFDNIADIYVLNTCSVTNNADKECRMLVRRIQRKAPEAMVVVTGCYAQLKPNEIASIPGVDLVLGAAEKFNITQHLNGLAKQTEAAKICSCDIEEVAGFNSSYSLNDRTRSFLKVQDGCSYNCSFCTIPMARGKSRSDSIANVIANAQTLAANGVKEIVLTGVNLGDFGRGQTGALKHQENFIDLLKALDKVKGIERYRISSCEPNLLTTQIIEFVASSGKFMPHFHIPLQSGSDKILGLMRRRYKTDLYTERVAKIKALMPHCCIGVDVIVGFPGETDDDFITTYNYLNNLDISYLHVFTYSERPDTLAENMPNKVAINARNNRNKALRNLSYKKQQFFEEKFKQTSRKVLFEQIKNGFIHGYTDNYIRVNTVFKKELENNIINWVI